MSKDVKSVISEFHASVNMTAKELESWLKTEESQSVGQKKDDDESIGHKSGKRIIELLHKKKDDYTDDDLSHMKKVVSYVHRHSAQQPEGDVEDTNWRYSLMNWGHDPLKSKS
jgi:DNA topoisomerase VI subunit B